jgi:hypothetical protein
LPKTWAQTIVKASAWVGLTLPDAGPRTAAEQPDVVGDLEESRGDTGQRPMHEDERVMGGERLEFIRRAGEGNARQFRHPRRENLGEARHRVQAGADRRAALGERVEIGNRLADARGSERHLCRIAGEFLAERDRCRILQMGAADFHDRCESLCLDGERVAQRVERRQQPLLDLLRHGDVHGGRETVVRGLPEIDMVVGVDRCLGAERRPHQLVGPVGNDFIDIHVGLGARPGLPDDQREMPIEAAVGHLLRRVGNGEGARRVENAELAVGLCRDPFDERERVDQRQGNAFAADAEMLQRPLGLGPPIAVGGDLDFTERISLRPGLRTLLGARHVRPPDAGGSVAARPREALPHNERIEAGLPVRIGGEIAI